MDPETPPEPPRAIPLAVRVGALGCLVVASGALYVPMIEAGNLAQDFKVFWTAARVPGALVYDSAALTAAQLPLTGEIGPRPFVSPPSSLALLHPFGHLPFWIAFAAWTLLFTLLFVAVVARTAGRTAAALVLIAPAVQFAAAAGQITLLVGALVLGGLMLLARAPLLAGLLLAAAALLKPQALVLLPLGLIAAGQVRTLLVATLAGAAAGLLCLWIQGPALWWAWADAMLAFSALLENTTLPRKGIAPASLAHLFGLQGAYLGAATITFGALGAFVVWRIFRRSADPILRGGAVACGYLLATPYAMPYEGALLAPAAALLLIRPQTAPVTRFLSPVALCFPFSPVVTLGFAAALVSAVSRPSLSPSASLSSPFWRALSWPARLWPPVRRASAPPPRA